MATDVAGDKAGQGIPNVLSTPPKKLPFDFLKTITDQFSEDRILAEGAFGVTYKGIVPGPEEQFICVKKLSENAPVPREKAFTNEVQNILALHHKNIVKVVAFGCEGEKTVVLNNGRYILADLFQYLICYEYLPSRGLHDSLFGDTSIHWSRRFKIINDVCDGLLFIHSIPIVHMDLKPENIWLDNNMVAKIANFGLSRLFGQEQTRMNTQNVVGSYGYIAPEYLYRGEISLKTDIYSLGLIIMEITTGEKNCHGNEPSGMRYIRKIRNEWTDERIAAEYKSLDATCLHQVRTCIELGLECVEIDRQKRPPIENILVRLSGRICV